MLPASAVGIIAQQQPPFLHEPTYVCVCACVFVCVRVFVRVFVRVGVCVCVRACVKESLYTFLWKTVKKINRRPVVAILGLVHLERLGLHFGSKIDCRVVVQPAPGAHTHT